MQRTVRISNSVEFGFNDSFGDFHVVEWLLIVGCFVSGR